MHALIIEDEVLVVELIEQSLRELGYRSFDVAFSASEALAAAKRRCPELITADLKLVDGSGVDAVQEICAEQAIPVLFISGNAHEIRRLLPQAIVVDKPFQFAALEAAVAEAADHPFSSSAIH